MAYAGAEFAVKVIKALKGEKGIIAPSYVSLEADVAGGEALKKELGGASVEFFSAPVELGVSIPYYIGIRLVRLSVSIS